MTIKNRLPSLLLPLTFLVSVLCSPCYAQPYTPVGSDIFSFDNVTNVVIDGGSKVLSGSLTGTGGSFTGFSGTFGGEAITSFSGVLSSGTSGGSYAGSSGAYTFSGPLAFDITTSSGTYEFGASSIKAISPGRYKVTGSWTEISSGTYASYQSYGAVAAPEIDGSVVPKAGFVIAGLFWLVMYRRRQGAGLEA